MTKVSLRKKPISGGRQTLYLDYYPAIPHPETGKPTRREFLKLFIYDKAKTATEKQHNKETLHLADNIKAGRQLDLQNEQYGFLTSKKEVIDFITYFDGLAHKRLGSTQDIWLAALRNLKLFTGGKLKLTELNEQFCVKYREYLITSPRVRDPGRHISLNTASMYFGLFKAALRQAYKDKLITTDLNAWAKSIKGVETERQFLTIDELQTLAKTDCALPLLKKAALFSALTGMRFSDIAKLTWGDIRHAANEGYYIQFRQQKTKGVEVLQVSDDTISRLGASGEPEARIFDGLNYSVHMNNHLKAWVLKAGITKKITFHCFRHTFAGLQLSLGTDIYTLSKLLGHRELKTTQVYAHVLDKAKREAANRIKLDL